MTFKRRELINFIYYICKYVTGFQEIGGYEALQEKYMQAIPSVRPENTSCGLPREDAFHILRHPVNSDNPWPGLILQSSLGCMWYWCCDQVNLTFFFFSLLPQITNRINS